MQVAPHVRAVMVPGVEPDPTWLTTIYLVGGGQSLTIDSGDDYDRFRWMLKGYLAAVERTEIGMSAVTHHHFDHSSNLRWLRDQFGADIYHIDVATPLLTERVPPTGVHTFKDGEEILVEGGVRLLVLHTPGHSVDSV